MMGRYYIAVFLLFSTLATVEVDGITAEVWGVTYPVSMDGATAMMECRKNDAANYKDGSGAIDGILRETSDTRGSDIVHSCVTDYPWLCIDLGSDVTVELVRVFNRPTQRYVSPRMDGFHVGFPDACPHVGMSMSLGAHTECGSLQDTPLMYQWSYVTCAEPTRARYVMIQSSSNVLNLMEVQAFKKYSPPGATARMECRKNDAANYKDGSGAIDGVLRETSDTTGSDIVHSCDTPNPWLCIDLGEVFPVDSVRVFNRPTQKWVSPRMDGFLVGFPDSCPQVGMSMSLGAYTECGLLQDPPLMYQWSTVTCTRAQLARYILIQSTSDILNLMEVGVVVGPSPSVYIKHDWSRLCVAKYDGLQARLETCVDGDLEQQWFWDGRYLMNRASPDVGLYCNRNDFWDQRNIAIEFGRTLCQACLGRTIHGHDDLKWRMENGYLTNAWVTRNCVWDDCYTAQKLSLVPYERRFGGKHRWTSGRVGDNVGCLTRLDDRSETRVMKWTLRPADY